MNIEELYKQKGELLTTIEIAQAKLRAVNEQIIKLLNESKESEVKDVATT